MFQIFREEPWITAAILGFMVISLFIKVLLGFLYQNMIREADNMATTDNRLLKQCKLKFANCYQLNNGVSNIPVFVDKFLNRLTLGPFSFETLYHLSGQSMLLSVIFAGVGASRGIAGGKTLGDILPFYIVSFLGLYLYFSISSIVDVKTRKRVLKVNLVDYLENHLSARIGVTESDLEMLYGDEIPGRGKNRRTVELMPFNNSSRMRPDTAEIPPADMYAGLQAAAGMPEAMGQPVGMAAASGQAVGLQAAGMPAAGMQAGGMAAVGMPMDPPGSNVLSNFHITVEELESLIKEFC